MKTPINPEFPSLRACLWISISSGFVSGFVFFRVGSKYLAEWLPHFLIVGFSVVLLLTGLLVMPVAYWRARYSRRWIAWQEGLLVSCLALDLSLFGWQKILKLQMIVPLGLLDTPFSSLSGETLVWAFYRFSYPFMVSIALLQLVCAYLLLLPKTRLLPLLMAIPMLVNIIGMDYFYHMPTWVLLHAIVLMLGVTSLLRPDFPRLRRFFLSGVRGLIPIPISSLGKMGVKLTIVVLPIFFFLTYHFPDKNPELTGKYQVRELLINGVGQSAKSPKDSVLTTVYLDLDNEFAFDFNDYRYRFIGTYQYQKVTDSLTVTWRYPAPNPPSFAGKLYRDQTGLRLEGIIADDTLKMHLEKQ